VQVSDEGAVCRWGRNTGRFRLVTDGPLTAHPRSRTSPELLSPRIESEDGMLSAPSRLEW